MIRLIAFTIRLTVFTIRLIAFTIRLIAFAIRLIVFMIRLIAFAIRLIAFVIRLIAFTIRLAVSMIELTAVRWRSISLRTSPSAPLSILSKRGPVHQTSYSTFTRFVSIAITSFSRPVDTGKLQSFGSA